MTYQKNKFFYFDLDGTLLNSKNKVSSKNIKALKELKNNKYKFGLVTGRPLSLTIPIIDKVKPNLPTILTNGSLIQENSKIILNKLINKNETNKIIEFLIKNKINFLAYTTKEIFYYGTPKLKRFKMIQKLSKDKANGFPFNEMHQNRSNNDITKFLCLIEDTKQERQKMVYNFLKDKKNLYAIQSGANIIDIMPIGHSKGKALKILESKSKIKLKDTIVFGNADNDVSMFDVANDSVAMKNANKYVKSKASYVTDFPNTKNGVSKFLKKLKYIN